MHYFLGNSSIPMFTFNEVGGVDQEILYPWHRHQLLFCPGPGLGHFYLKAHFRKELSYVVLKFLPGVWRMMEYQMFRHKIVLFWG